MSGVASRAIFIDGVTWQRRSWQQARPRRSPCAGARPRCPQTGSSLPVSKRAGESTCSAMRSFVLQLPIVVQALVVMRNAPFVVGIIEAVGGIDQQGRAGPD